MLKLKKLLLLARRSAGKGTGLLVVQDRKGIRLIVDVRGWEWIPTVRVEMSRKSLQVRENESMKIFTIDP